MQTEPGERGHLRVFLGAAPGAGTTCAMLAEGHRAAARGTDVVVALVQTHGRPATEAALDSLEVLRTARSAAGDPATAELDVAAVLARGPQLALVDELGHRRAGGEPDDGRTVARWQEVERLLGAGIDVVSTLDVQQLESLVDVVESVTGTRPPTTVPDALVRAAEVELVDISPPALRRRLAQGDLAGADRPDVEQSRFYREGNLAALRELSLLWLAERVDEDLERYRSTHGIEETWATRERVVVGVSGAPESAALMRRAARIASRAAGSEWLAVYVTPRHDQGPMTPQSLERLAARAEELGGSFRSVVAADVAEGLLDFARGVNATQVLIGASRRSRLSALLRPGTGEIVVAECGEIDVHVVSHDYAHRGQGARRRRATVGRTRRRWGYLLAVGGTAALAAALELTADLHGLPTESLLMLTMVVATALVGGLLPAVVAALLGGLGLNFLFVAPTRTLTVADPENALALVVFLVVGTAVATVVDRAARRSEQAVRARAEANALAVLAQNLVGAGDSQTQLLARAAEMFGMTGAAVLETGPDGAFGVAEAYGDAPDSPARSDATAEVAPGVVLALRGHTLRAADRSLLTAYAAHVAVLRERRRAVAEAAHAAELAEANRTRTALLAAVSHDLRSPLAVTKAAVSSLRGTEVVWSSEDRAELLAVIEDATDQLVGLVANLLDMSRLQTGAVNPLTTSVDLDAAVTGALGPLPGAEEVEVRLGPDLPYADVDPGLLERVVANVVENALRHTPAGTRVQITGATWTDEQRRDRVSVRVADHGPGVPASARDALFAPFQQLGDVPQGDGLGLGLAVARGLTEAMHGTLTAEDTPGGGLTMAITLPATAGDPR
ncbi:MAG: kdpD [Friedmanniella sp.]|nr:kdpD [Friedmanniella sp.]